MNRKELIGGMGLALGLVLLAACSKQSQPPGVPAALSEAVAELQRNPANDALREKIIKLALDAKVAVPVEAERFGDRGGFAAQNARSVADFAAAADEFERALSVAPWVADYYFNLGILREKAGQPDKSAASFKWYLIASPNAEDARTVRQRVATLEYAAEQKARIVIPDLGIEMIWIRPGTFQMGSASGESNERPVTQVTISKPFWLGKTEVTQIQWQALMASNPSTYQEDNRPVEYIFWDDAIRFCQKLTSRERAAGRLPGGYEYTLPTEAQWEYACRAGTTGDYAGNLDEMGWYDDFNRNATYPVAQKKANAWGLYDMHGNVSEICMDWYGNYPGGHVIDPTGAGSGTRRIIRGGSVWSNATMCRSVHRGRLGVGSSDRGCNIGFRLALAPTR